MLEFHPVTEIFPLMQGEQYDQLVQDIRENDLQEPIWLHKGQIIDGRNRHRACLDAGVEPRFRTWNGEGSLIQFVVSLNLHRRHLTSSQRAAAAAEALDQLKVEAKARQQEGGKDKVPQKIGEASKHEGEATHQAAKMFGTNRAYVAQAAKIKDEDESTFKAILKGDLTLSETNLIREYITGPARDRTASLDLDAPDRVILARLAKQSKGSHLFEYDSQAGIKRVLDVLEADAGRTTKQVVKQVRGEIRRDKEAQQQRREEQERDIAEQDEREFQEREPFEHFAEFLAGELAPSAGSYLFESTKYYDLVIRHLKNCKLTKLTAALEKMKAEFDAEVEEDNKRTN